MSGDRDISEAGRRLREAMEAAAAEAVARVHADVVQESPVATGRFRASWFWIEGGDTSAVEGEASEGSTIGAPTTVTPGEINPTIDQRIVNNLPYAERLCLDGWSNQVPPDWFTRIAQEWESGDYLNRSLEGKL